jgi:hypothetical protein
MGLHQMHARGEQSAIGWASSKILPAGSLVVSLSSHAVEVIQRYQLNHSHENTE